MKKWSIYILQLTAFAFLLSFQVHAQSSKNEQKTTILENQKTTAMKEDSMQQLQLSVLKPSCPELSPPLFIEGPDKACLKTPVYFTVGSAMEGHIFQWYATAGTVNSGAGDGTYATFSSLPAEIKVVRISTDAAHCVSDTLRKTIQPEMPAIVMTTNAPASVCGSTQWNFDLNYDNADLYQWKVLDPAMGSVVIGSTTAHVEVLFNNPITASQVVKVAVAVTKCNQVQYDTISINVINAPTFTVTPGSSTYCANEGIQFTISPTPTGYSSLNWEFGDGNTSAAPNPIHPYSSTGAVAIYYPAVTIVHPSGCLSTVTLQAGPISVKPTPVAHITPESITYCGSFSETLIADVTTGFGSTTNFEWFGPTAGPNCPTCDTWNSINQYGAYYVVVTNSNGCSGTSNIVPVVEYCPTFPCLGPTPLLITSDSSFLSCAEVRANVSYNPNGLTIIDEAWISSFSAMNLNTVLGTNASATASFSAAGVYTFIYVVTYLNGLDTCSVGFPQDVYVPFVGDMLYDVNCGTGSDYSITLHDHSNFFPGEVLIRTYQYKAGSGPWITITAAPPMNVSATIDLPAGSYEFREIISSSITPAAPACTTVVSLVLPDKPIADFTIAADYLPACVRDVVVNFTNTSTPGGLSFVWNFGDGSTNYQTNLGKVYDNASPSLKTVTLLATNTLGCSNSLSKNVEIKPNPYWDGATKPTITASPSTPLCQGNTVNLIYNPPLPLGTQSPPYYTWYSGNSAITPVTLGLSTFPVTQPGGYRVIGSDAFGCRVPSTYKVVDFIQIPPAVISGSLSQCENEPFTLNGFAGNIPGLAYDWQRSPGGTVGNTASITETLPVGTYTYILTLSLNGCPSESVPFTVTVSGPPAPPSLNYSIINCNPYTVEMNASNSQAGNYNWSNGSSGTPAYAHAGGYYLVTFTAQNGCTSQNSIYVEKSPEEFIWIFPTGCFCPSLFENTDLMSPTASYYYCRSNTPYITRPIVPFFEWAYLFSGGVDVNGSNSLVINPYDNFLTLGPGVYNLYLSNGTCDVTSEDMIYGSDYCDMVGGRPSETNGMNEQSSPMLRLIPNPAKGQSLAEYRFSDKGNERSIEVYDLLGRKVQSYPINSREGSLMLPLTAFAAGMYQVCLREDGKVIAQSKLSVSR